MGSIVFRILSVVLAATGTSLLLPLAVAFHYREYPLLPDFAAPAVLCWLLVLALLRAGRKPTAALRPESAFLSVGIAWICVCLFGALPLFTSGFYPGFTDAFFESVSGFTTTGATVLGNVEILPHCINLWRCEMHWLGGMGVIALTVALVPGFGAGAFQLIKAETSGPEKGKLTARITDSAKVLWSIYTGLTIVQMLLLKLAGFSWFDALCHSFSTLGTGGFSTRNASIGAFNNPMAEWICTLFMFLAAINFSLYYQLFSGRARDAWRNSEFRVFLLITAAAISGIALLENTADSSSVPESLRTASFHVASVLSTTGFVCGDYLLWLPASQMILLLIFFTGGSSGSTAGGVKIIRWTILAKQLGNELRRLLHPREIFTLRLNGQSGRDELLPVAASFIFVYMLLVGMTAFVGALGGLEPFTAFTGALSMVGNIGPAFGELGPTANCGFLPSGVKWWYTFAMLAGRLEIYTLIILLGCAFPFSRRHSSF